MIPRIDVSPLGRQPFDLGHVTLKGRGVQRSGE
jgi:hypothetical protein